MSDPYWDYKDKVNYDYEFKANIPIKFEATDDLDNKVKPSQEVLESVCESFEKGISELISDEDYDKEMFEELGLGRVYPGVNYAGFDDIEMYFGISLIDAETIPSLEDLKADIREYMSVLDSNADYDGGAYDYEKDKMISVRIICDKASSVTVEVLKQPETKVSEHIDKQLVKDGKLVFESSNGQKVLSLSNDGIIEVYENNKLVSSKPFSKLTVQRECKLIMQEGYVLLKEENVENINPEEMKKEIEKGIEEVDKLQDLKDELEDKVDKLVNESESKEIESFPSTEQTAKPLSYVEMKTIKLDNILNEDQKSWVLNNLGEIQDVELSIKDFAKMIKQGNNYSISISLDEYITELFDNMNLEWR